MTMNKLSSSDINVKEILEQSPTGVQHDAERNGIKSLVPLKLTPDIEKEGIVKAFTIDKRRGNIILELNHEYQNRKIISAIYEDWTKTVRLFDKQLKKKGVSRKHSLELADILDNNYVKVSDLEARKGRGSSSREQEIYLDRQQNGHNKSFVRKYTIKETNTLNESIVVNEQSFFVRLNESMQPLYSHIIDRPSKTLYPADNIDSQNPLPYIFDNEDELQRYLGLAKKETIIRLYFNVKSILKKFVNAEEHTITLLAADIIYSYFQDKFPTVHYNIFVGDNGSGKNSALLVFRYLGYRVFYVTAASAANYYTFLGEIEECQGTIAEDEADDIGYDKDKQRVLKTGYASGGNVPKVDLSNGRTQGSYLTNCMKWLAMEELPDYKKIKGILDRSFIHRFVTGKVPFNIKDVIKHAGSPKHKELHDELLDTRKLLLAFRMLHYNDVFDDISLNVTNRSAELTKPPLRLFYSLGGNSSVVVEEISMALSTFINEKNDLRKNSIESKLYDAINNLIKKKEGNPTSDEYKGLDPYSFYNEQIWPEVREVMNGQDIPFKKESFYAVEHGVISHKQITSVYRSKFKAQPFKVGSGSESKRGLKFSKEVLDRISTYYDVPDKIEISSGSREGQKHQDTVTDATDATDATNLDDKQGINDHFHSDAENCPDESSKYNHNGNDGSDVNTSNSVDTDSHIISNTDYPSPSSSVNDDHNDRCGNRNYNQSGCYKNTDYTTILSSKTVASVGSVATADKPEIHKIKEPGVLRMPCIFQCGYQDHSEFRLSLHLLEFHKPDLLRLPIHGGMEYRADYAVDSAKKRLASSIKDDEVEGNDDYDEDS